MISTEEKYIETKLAALFMQETARTSGVFAKSPINNNIDILLADILKIMRRNDSLACSSLFRSYNILWRHVLGKSYHIDANLT